MSRTSFLPLATKPNIQSQKEHDTTRSTTKQRVAKYISQKNPQPSHPTYHKTAFQLSLIPVKEPLGKKFRQASSPFPSQGRRTKQTHLRSDSAQSGTHTVTSNRWFRSWHTRSQERATIARVCHLPIQSFILHCSLSILAFPPLFSPRTSPLALMGGEGGKGWKSALMGANQMGMRRVCGCDGCKAEILCSSS